MVKFIICRGIGFNPGSVKYIPTFGFLGPPTPATGLFMLNLLGVGR